MKSTTRKHRAHVLSRMARAMRSPIQSESLERRYLLSSAGLVAAYGFEENTGTTVADLSGNGNAGTITGAAWNTTGKFGNSLTFNGTSNLVSVPDSSSLHLSSAMTLEAWVYPTSTTGVHDVVIKEGTNVDVYNLYSRDAIGFPDSDVLVGSTNYTAEGTALPANTWSHLAGSYDGTTLKIYINGALVSSQVVAGAMTTSTGALRIGGNNIWGEYFAGRIDEVRVYNRALPQSEIQTDMSVSVTQATADTTPPGVQATTPLNGAKNVVTSITPTITFTEAMTTSTITTSTIELRDPTGAIVPSTVTYNASTFIATIHPNAALTAFPNGYFTATVHGGTGGVKDLAGNPMTKDFAWSFTTATPTFQDNVVISGLYEPTNIQWASDGRIFIAQKSGVIVEFDSLNDTTPTVVADLNVEVHDFWDKGLLGMALDPQFPTRPYIYILYTYDGVIGGSAPKYGTPGVLDDPGPNATTTGAPDSGRLSRITINPTTNTMVAGSEQVIINDWFNQFYTHSIGTVAFGPDGYLYVGGGDGAEAAYADYGQTGGNPGGDPVNEGGALRSQDLRTPNDPTTLDGSIIRIDPNTGAAVSTNPLYASGNDANAKRIIAEGLRNPYRFTFRPGTNEIWISDTGWATWEEIDRITNATGGSFQNFGWPAYEGQDPQGGYQALNLPLLNNLYADPSAVTYPYYTYNHNSKVDPTSATEPTGSSAIAGVAFYQGIAYPQAFQGALFFSDYSRSRIWVMYSGGNGDPNPGNIQTFDVAAHPVGLFMGPDGNLYYPDLDDGQIHQIQYFASNRPPSVVMASNVTSGVAPLTVHFDGSGSSDPDAGDTISYSWDLNGDGVFGDSTAAQPTYTYTSPGRYVTQLKVTDNHGLASTSSLVISVGNAPVPVIDSPGLSFHWKVGDLISFTGHATDTEDGTLPASALTWTFSLYQAAEETPTQFILRNSQTFNGVASGSYAAPDWEYPVYIQATLTATDSTGLQTTVSERLDPQLVTFNLQSTPPGLSLIINARTKVAPLTKTAVVNSSNTIGAITPQVLGGTTYYYSNWSDSGSATHTITASASPVTYTATYSTTPGPVAAYNFDAGSGTSLTDLSGHGNNGTISGATWVTTGKYGGALSFNGTSSMVTIPDASSLELTNGMTLEAWVNLAATTGTRDVLVKEGTKVDIYNLYARNDAGKPEGNAFIGTSNKTAQGTALPANTWTHLAATYNGATIVLYVNGVVATTTAASGPISVSNGALRIGGNTLWGEFFQGMIDDVRIYDQALTQAQVQNDMNTAITSGPVNHPPTAVITADKTSGPIPLTVNLSGTSSTDPDAGDSITYAWDLDNNGLFNDSTSATPSVTFTTAGSKTVRLQVTDSHGLTSTASLVIAATNPNNQPPTMFIDTPLSSPLWKVGDLISFSGHATDPEDITIPASGLAWQFILHQGSTTTTLQTFNGVASGTFTVPNETYPAYLEVKATATDSSAAQNSTSVQINPQTTTLNFATSPSGLQLTVDGTASTTPFSRTVIVNSSNPVTATSPQTLGTTNYFYSTWSDGGAATHNITAPASAATYTATYTTAPGPVAAYNFDAGSGTVLTDVSGNGNNGTIAGASWITTGKTGGALSFTADNQMVTVPNSSSLSLTNAMTLEAWVYPTINTGTRDVLIKEGPSVDYYNMYERNDLGKPEGNVFVGGSNKTAQGTALTINTWTHLATTYDGTSLKLYVNGALVTTTAVSGAIATSTGALRIGGNSIWGEWYRGRLDDIRIYNRALSAAEVATDMNTSVTAPAVLPAMVATTAASTPTPPPTRTAVFAKTKVISLVDLVDEQTA